MELEGKRRTRKSSFFRPKSAIKLNTAMESSFEAQARDLMDFGEKFTEDDFPYVDFFEKEIMQLFTLLNHYLKMFCTCTCPKLVVMDHRFEFRNKFGIEEDVGPLKYLKELRSLHIDITAKNTGYTSDAAKIVKRTGNVIAHILSEHSDIDHRALEKTFVIGLKVLAFKKAFGGRYYNSISSFTLACAMCYYNEKREMQRLEPLENTALELRSRPDK